MSDSTQMEWFRPVPEVTADHKAEICGHTVMDLSGVATVGTGRACALPNIFSRTAQWYTY